MAGESRATILIERAAQGDQAALRDLLPLVYEELRAIAGSYFQRQAPGHTLQPTAVVHEAFVKIIDASRHTWESRAHFMAVAARAMRQILADHARSRKADKRGGRFRQVALEGLGAGARQSVLDVVALHDALEQLQGLHERHARVIEMRFFGGLTIRETAHVLGVSESTIEEDWRAARSFLGVRLSEDRTT